MERRYLDSEVRAHEQDGKRRILGYAVKWGSLSLPLWRDHRTGLAVREEFRRGAFADVLKGEGLDVVALRDHNRSLLLGRMASGTLGVREDETGLRYEIDPPDTTEGRDTLVLLDRGDLRGSSFSFEVAQDGDEWAERDGALVRTVVKVVALDDVGPVTRPAYPASEAQARSLDAAASLERFLSWRSAARDRALRLAEAESETLRLMGGGS